MFFKYTILSVGDHGSSRIPSAPANNMWGRDDTVTHQTPRSQALRHCYIHTHHTQLTHIQTLHYAIHTRH